MFDLIFKIAPKIHKNFVALQIITLKFFFSAIKNNVYPASNYHLAGLSA